MLQGMQQSVSNFIRKDRALPMKIPKNKDVTDINSVAIDRASQTLLNGSTKTKKKSLIDSLGSEEQEQKIQLGLSKAISAEFDPEAMAAERRKKVEHLKKLVQSGQYNPPIEKVAEAVSQEIDFEILSAGNGEEFSK